jgi:hypothetical protein
MRTFLLVGILAIAGSVNALRATAAGPTVDLTVNGSRVPVDIMPQYDPSKDVWNYAWGTTLAEEFKVDLTGSAKTDPFLNYGISAQNFTAAPLTFTFTFTTPIVSAPYSTAFASVGGSSPPTILPATA